MQMRFLHFFIKCIVMLQIHPFFVLYGVYLRYHWGKKIWCSIWNENWPYWIMIFKWYYCRIIDIIEFALLLNLLIRKKFPSSAQMKFPWLTMGRIYIGCPKKNCPIKLKKKCSKKWRWPRRKLKIWYMCNNIMVFLFPKKYFSNFDLYSWYGQLNV